MALETATHIANLVSTNPAGGDDLSQGDDHLRMIKQVLLTDLPLDAPATALGMNILKTSTASGVRDLIGATSTPYRNKIINGSLSTFQKNSFSTSLTNGASPIYTFASRFFARCSGANTSVDSDAIGDAFSLKINGATSLSEASIGTTVYSVDAIDLTNQLTTLSALIQTNGTPITVTWSVYRPFSTADSYSVNQVLLASGTFSATSTPQRFAATFTPLYATFGLQIVFSVGAMASGVNIEFAEIQLEKGSIPAGNIIFENIQAADQLSRCKYFYTRFSTNGNLSVLGSGHQNSTTTSRLTLPIGDMRGNPNVVFGGSVLLDIAGATTAATLSAQYNSLNSVAFDVTHAAVGAAGDAAMLQLPNSTANFIEIDAEIPPYL